jgi:hypothetical protein
VVNGERVETVGPGEVRLKGLRTVRNSCDEGGDRFLPWFLHVRELQRKHGGRVKSGFRFKKGKENWENGRKFKPQQLG